MINVNHYSVYTLPNWICCVEPSGSSSGLKLKLQSVPAPGSRPTTPEMSPKRKRTRDRGFTSQPPSPHTTTPTSTKRRRWFYLVDILIARDSALVTNPSICKKCINYRKTSCLFMFANVHVFLLGSLVFTQHWFSVNKFRPEHQGLSIRSIKTGA